MKILVFSDSHGNTSRMKEAIEEHHAGCGLIIHLGDGVRDIFHVTAFYPDIPLISIQGNGETYSRDRRIFDLDGVRIMCIHGHSYGVKSGLDLAAVSAIGEGADLLLFGHTHTAHDSVYTMSSGKSVHLFNPGSIGYGLRSTYGVIKISRNGEIVTSHVTL